MAIASGLVVAESVLSNALLAATPIAGILKFEIVDSAVSATVAKQGGLTWYQDWIRYLKFSLPILAVGLAGIAITSWMLRASTVAKTDSFGLLYLLAFTVSLASYWALRALLHALPDTNRSPGESVLVRFKRSSNTEIALSMGVSIATAILYLILNSGFEDAEAFMVR